MKPRQPSRRQAGNGGNSIRLQDEGLGDAAEGRLPGTPSPQHPGGGSYSDAGRCPEVQGVLGHLPARRALRLRALLRPARGRLRAADADRRRAAGAASRRARTRSGATRTSCRSQGRAAVARCRRAGRRWCAPTASPSASGLGELWVKNDTANPTHSFKDRVVSVALARAPRARLRDRRLRLDRQPRQRGRRPRGRRRAARPTSSSRPTSRRRRSSPPASTARNVVAVRGNYDDVNRLCTELSGERAAGRSSTSTCGRTTPRAPRRSRSRPPSSSAGSCPTASSRRSPPARCSPRSRAASRSGSTPGLLDGDARRS